MIPAPKTSYSASQFYLGGPLPDGRGFCFLTSQGWRGSCIQGGSDLFGQPLLLREQCGRCEQSLSAWPPMVTSQWEHLHEGPEPLLIVVEWEGWEDIPPFCPQAPAKQCNAKRGHHIFLGSCKSHLNLLSALPLLSKLLPI